MNEVKHRPSQAIIISTVVFCLLGAFWTWLPDVAEAAEQGREEEKDNVPWGFLFVGGRYVPPPYEVETKDFAVFVNGREVMNLSPLPDPEEEQAIDEEAYWEGVDPEERKLRENINELCGNIKEQVFLWLDLYTPEEVNQRLAEILDKEKEKGQIMGYRLSRGPTTSIVFLRPDGRRLKEVGFTTGWIRKRLGPPYKEYLLGTEGFEKNLVEIARLARQEYDEKTATTIITNFLTSQPSVGKYSFADGEVLLESTDGRRIKVELPIPEKIDEQAEALARMYKRLQGEAKSFSDSLSKGYLVIVSSGLDGRVTIGSPDAEKAVVQIFEVMINPNLAADEKLKAFPERIQGLCGEFAGEIVENFAEYEELDKRLKKASKSTFE